MLLAAWLALNVLGFASARNLLATVSLDAHCSDPIKAGGTGNCWSGKLPTNSTLPTCPNTAKTTDFAQAVQKLQCQTCTQSTDARCKSAALKALIPSWSGVKAAYCNADNLVIVANGIPGYMLHPKYGQITPNLYDVLNPPGGQLSGGVSAGGGADTCKTRTWVPDLKIYKIPLKPVALSTSKNTNNQNTKAFPNGAGDGDKMYLSSNLGSYGLPSASATGAMITGLEIYPIWNNKAFNSVEEGNLDSCGEHVGQGGGPPHVHADPFGPYCLYDSRNYTDKGLGKAHPPQIGWSLDGYNIYGRHLSTKNEGYSTALDDCGGHTHGSYAYHYHAQVISSTSTDGKTKYVTMTNGPYKCWKGDISKVKGFWDGSYGASAYNAPCCGSKNYYQAKGITIPLTSKVSG